MRQHSDKTSACQPTCGAELLAELSTSSSEVMYSITMESRSTVSTAKRFRGLASLMMTSMIFPSALNPPNGAYCTVEPSYLAFMNV